MRLRQLVFVAADLAPAVDDIRAVFGLEVCFSDAQVAAFGLENALLPLNGNMLEVVAPIEEGTTAGRHLQRRGGDGGYMIIVQCADAVAERERVRTLGVRDVWRYEGEDAIATHYHPADVPGAIVSLDSMPPGTDFHRQLSYWKWAGPDWTEYVRTDRVQAITAIELQADNPGAVCEQWSKVLARPCLPGAKGPEILLDNGRLRFVALQDDRGLGISAIDVLPQNRSAIRAAAEQRGLAGDGGIISVCGVRVNLI
ncbi:MAG: hypothetical protein GKR94_01795 [Gammaproteobacteria bacterium]|nr:hypothetical protein [Gammaproteobacteria bacterium]